MSCNLFDFFQREIFGFTPLWGKKKNVTNWPFFTKKRDQTPVSTTNAQTQTKKKTRRDSPYKAIVIKPVPKQTEKVQTQKVSKKLKPRYEPIEEDYHHHKNYEHKKSRNHETEDKRVIFKQPAPKKHQRIEKRHKQKEEIKSEIDDLTTTESNFENGDNEDQTLHKLYFRDDNFLIMNPNFGLSTDSLTSEIHYSGELHDCDSYNTRLEKVLKKKCKHRLMGDEKCSCKLCSTLAVIRESMKHTGPFDWELKSNMIGSSRPSFSKAAKGKYINTSRYGYSISGFTTTTRVRDYEQTHRDRFEANRSYDVESLLYERLEQKLFELSKKVSEMEKSRTQHSNHDSSYFAKDSRFSNLSSERHPNLTFRNVKFIAEGTMDIIGESEIENTKIYSNYSS